MIQRPPGPSGNLLFGSLPELTADWLGYMGACARQYGPVVRFKTPWPLAPIVLLTEPSHIEQVLKDQIHFQKGLPQRIGAPILGKGLILSEKDQWRRQRRMAAAAFQRNKMAVYVPDMAACAEEMVDGWKNGDKPDVFEDATRMMVRIVARTLFGNDAGEETEPAARGLTEAMAGFDAYFNSWYPTALPLPTRSALRIRSAAKRLEAVIYKFIADRRRDGEERNDLLSTLLRARDEEDGSAFDERELRDMAINIFGAGFETSAVTLAWTLYLLAQHPEIAQRVRDEVDQVVGGEHIRAEHVNDLKFTEKVIKESMRLFPAAWLIPREALCDWELAGFHIDRGAQIFVCTYLVHHNEAFYPNPDCFDPDRWTDEFIGQLPKCAYLPFGAGHRICIGSTFAMMDLSIAIATVMRRVRLDLTDQLPEPPHVSFTLRPRNGVKLRITQIKSGVADNRVGCKPKSS